MDKKLNIEGAFARLDEISLALEAEDISLETSLKLYEEGSKLIAFCDDAIKNAELKVTEIKGKILDTEEVVENE